MPNTLDRENIIRWFFADRIPLVKLLIVVNVFTFIALVLFRLGVFSRLLGFNTSMAMVTPWTAFTYPLVGAGSPISLLFAGYWLWVAGGSLERSWGTRTFGIFFFAAAAVSAVGILAGSMLAHTGIGLAGLWLPLAATTVAFAMLNPEQQILFFFVIPLKLKYLAMLSAAMVLISYGQASLALGILALAGCAFGYWFVRTGKQYGFNSAPRRSRDTGSVVRVYGKQSVVQRLNPFRGLKDRRDRERLRKLFEQSDTDEGGHSDR